jgi:transcriptional regulator with XRE-family HTH domain
MDKTIYTQQQKYLVTQLKKARLEAKLKQSEVGKAIGKDQTFVSKVESAQYRLDVIQLNQFAQLYKKKLTYFIK